MDRDAAKSDVTVTIYDRHLLWRFLYACVVFFVAAMGLYVVVDGFTNLDGFQHAADRDGTGGLLAHMGRHYLFQSSLLLELVGPTVAVVAVTATLALMCKQGELHPLLAAGIPTYRLCLPFVVGMVIVNAVLIANQEFVVPRISVHLQGSHGHTAEDARPVEPCLSAAGIFIAGKELYLTDRRLHRAEFRFSPGAYADRVFSLTADDAYFLPKTDQWPSMWLLKGPSDSVENLPLTEAGRKIVVPRKDSGDLFVLTEVTFDELYNRSASFKFLSTPELLTRVRRPSSGTSASRQQLIHLHARLTRPAMLVIGVFLVFPVLIRKDSSNLITNIAMSTLVLGAVFGVSQAFQFIGQAGIVSPTVAAWTPLIGSAGLSAWMSPMVRS